jgi:hypothetical protein
MYRWPLVALGGLTAYGLAALVCWWAPADEPPRTPRQCAGPTTFAEVQALVASQNLYWVADPEDGPPSLVMIVSDGPLSQDQRSDLWMEGVDFARWRGVVRIHRGGRECLQANWNPDHPERFALWGEFMVYGDPALIAKLLGESR